MRLKLKKLDPITVFVLVLMIATVLFGSVIYYAFYQS